MANSSDQLEKLKVLISSGSRADKCYAYSSLLHFQEQSSDSSASIQALAGSSRTLLSLIVADISDDDEEIAAQALKCLGFMIYHPSLVAAVVVDDAILVIESLVKLIVTTKMKSVCNLGVWCISIQQFRAPFLHAHFDSLLQAVVHALNNPIGSLSTTFEAIQALVKDIKQRLLTQMKELLKKGIKVQTIHAWGWFIRLLGSHAMKNRHLINEMLKIPEHTFSDLNPQVLIATQVAWEGLIDALIHPPIVAGDRNAAKEGNGVQQVLTSGEKIDEPLVNGFSKSIKLVMTPLLGIISGRCDISVHLSCLNTWCCLLHKLDTSVNDPSVIKLVLEPIFEAVFLIGPDNKTMRLWNLCLDLLDDFILAKCRGVEHDKSGLASQQSSTSTSIPGPSVPGKFLWKQYSVKWLPWHISQLDFHLKMILVLINQASIASFTHENRSLARDAALRLFVSVLKGVRLELKSQYSNYNNIMSCLGTVLGFIKHICEEVHSEGSDSNDFEYTSLLFIEAINQELEPTILGSPLYKVSLDLKHIDNL
ncbi:uncharacterized protein LOC108990921 isoform X3 [Juglans regia]|uniref:Uncharacterized protein LOC108990921 isoform X3 n=1 Tax=Juglans regia TaxID=51240 RepID=A0A6P9ERE9_JUGRE|nr:uncharacterized protein LOC108990921 isoform X3 [Juglans regia]